MNLLRVQINLEDIIFQENDLFLANLEEAINLYNSMETFFIKISSGFIKYAEVKRKEDQ